MKQYFDGASTLPAMQTTGRDVSNWWTKVKLMQANIIRKLSDFYLHIESIVVLLVETFSSVNWKRSVNADSAVSGNGICFRVLATNMDKNFGNGRFFRCLSRWMLGSGGNEFSSFRLLAVLMYWASATRPTNKILKFYAIFTCRINCNTWVIQWFIHRTR